MANDEETHSPRFLEPVVVMVFPPVLYLASWGPVYWLHDGGVLSEPTWESICLTVYRPVIDLGLETEFFDSPLGNVYAAYLEMFAD